MLKLLTFTTLALAASSASALDLNYTPPTTAYVEGGIGIDRHNGVGFVGKRTLGQITVGVQSHNFFIEFRHESNVQLNDEGNDTIWFGLRKEVGL